MPLSNLLKSAAGTCLFCNQKAGILSREHPGCGRTYQADWQEMVRLAGGAARSHDFQANTLQIALAEIAKRSFGDGSTVNQALEEGWKQGVAHAMADGIISPDEEDRLKEFENQMALMPVPKPIPKWDVHFEGLEDYRKDPNTTAADQ